MYKGVLTDWNNVPIQGVAVKTLKGNTIQLDVHVNPSMLSAEIFPRGYTVARKQGGLQNSSTLCIFCVQ